jgi:hypothetical protein
MSDLSAPFLQVSSEATRRFCEQGQSVAKTISDWNTEVSHFVSHRVAQNNETFGSMAKCQNFGEVFALQAQWVQDATDDYVKEMNKLMEFSSRMMGGLFGSFGHFETQSAEQTRSSPAMVPMRAAS